MWKILGGIKAYLFLGLGLLAAMAGVRWRYVEKKNDKLETEVAAAKAVITNKERIEKADKETAKRTASRRAEARNEIKNPDNSNSGFADPNKLRRRKNRSD